MSRFRDIPFPKSYRYSSDSEHIPLEFYEEAFPIAKEIDLLLGYFSSNAIRVLSKSFAEFIVNGGKMRIITNHVYSLKDYQELLEVSLLKEEDKIIDIFTDLEYLERALSSHSRHFFDCLRYLLKNGKLEILPVKFNNVDLAHCKRMILYDGKEHISTEGSINFTLPALLKNSESFQVETPWNGRVSSQRVQEEIENFNRIFNKKHPSYQYISPEKIEVVIYAVGKEKDLNDLLDDSLKLDNDEYSQKVKKILQRKKQKFEEKIEQIKSTPKFPFPDGPRDYQKEAYEKWKRNNYMGVFAMATGTGKTITSLNCVLNELNKNGYYRTIILVPSIALLDQWEEEVKSFRFSKVLKVGGGNNWEKELGSYTSNFNWGIKDDLIIISTYGSFLIDKFQKYFKLIGGDFLLIADEAHNMGANNFRKKLIHIPCKKRIGLSATPKRIYDVEGTDALNEFFHDSPPYTFDFPIEKALVMGFLTEYKYFPIIVELNEVELQEYIDISKKLLRFFDFEKGAFKKDPIAEILLLKRKNIIHKASSKVEVFKSILQELKKQNKLNFAFVYVPEGYAKGEENESEKILNKFIRAGAETGLDFTMNSYTSEDENLPEILRGFSEGKIDLLFAMKMLDEGIDIPRAEVGIFCSSTGNPRQFIQRRGRLLRNHREKAFATIFDLVVAPQIAKELTEFYRLEKNLVEKELQRVAYFASFSMNFYDSQRSLEPILNKYDINLDELIQEL